MCKYLSTSILLFLLVSSYLSHAQSYSTEHTTSIAKDSTQIYVWLDKAWEYNDISTAKAQKYAQQALELAQKIGYKKGIAAAYSQIAVNFDIAAKKDSALLYNYKALSIQKKLNDRQQQSTTFHNLGAIYESLGQFDKAISFFNKSLDIDRELKDSLGMAWVFINIGINHKNKKEYTEAEEAYKKAISLFEKKHAFQDMPTVYVNLANLYLQKGEIQKAKLVGKKTFNLLKKYPHSASLISLNGILSDVALKAAEYNEAIRYANNQLAIINTSGRKDRLPEVYHKLSTIYEQKGDYQEALQYMRQYADSSEAMLSKDFHQKLAEMDVQYKTAEQASQLKAAKLQTAEEEALRKEKEIQLTKAINFRNIFILSAIIFLLIALLLYLRNRSSQKLNIVYKEKNQIAASSLVQKEMLLKELNHRVKNNLQLITSILELQSAHLTDPLSVAALKDSINRVQSITLVHDKLYQTENFDRFNIKTYLATLIDEVMDAFENPGQRIQLDFDIESIILDVRTVVSLGLIVNELITNTFKYAFAKRPNGRLSIQLFQKGQHIKLSIEDDGEGFVRSKAPGGFGFSIVQSLVRQLDGQLEIVQNKGTQIHIQFKNYIRYESESQDISR